MHRYQDVLGSTYLSFAERSWLESIFRKFASRPGCWSESDLTSFLALSFPEPSKYLLDEVGPTLHRLVLRVGSYPYHQDPAKELDLGTLRTAIVILLRKEEEGLRQTDIDGDENEVIARLKARYTRLLFQSLAATPSLDTNQKGQIDDDDVVEALRIISKRRFLRHPVNPKIGIPGPPIPSPGSLPSSHSQQLGGHVSKADLQALTGLFLACQLYWGGSGPEQVVESPSDGLNRSIDCVLRSFAFDQEERCGWQSFKRVIAKQEPGLQIAMPRILESLINKPPTIEEDTFRSLTRTEATELLHGECKGTESTFPTSGAILNLPLLCQLALFLPEDTPLDKAKPILSLEKEQQIPELAKAHIRSVSHASLLVASGSTTPARPSSTSEQIVCGIYLPSENSMNFAETATAIIFQCQPVHSVWTGKISRENSSLRGDLMTDDLTFRIDNSLKENAELHVNSQLREGKLTVPTAAKSDDSEPSHFVIKNLEVFDIPPVAD